MISHCWRSRLWFGLLLVLFTNIACAAPGGSVSPTAQAALPTSTLLSVPTITTVPSLSPATSAPLPPTLTPAPSPQITRSPAPTSMPTPILHVVQAGETLLAIAQQYGVSATDIARANYLIDPSLIAIGQTLFIPAPGNETPPDDWPATPYRRRTIGYSAENRPIEVFSFGSGPNQLAFVGGIHGGYEWNTVLLAYQTLAYLAANPESIPEAITVHVIPSANPDGVYHVTGKTGWFSPLDVAEETFGGRFNGNGVDLNRNWPCHWSAVAFWRDERVDAGTAPLSEPENQALRDFFLAQPLQAVIFWHSAMPLVSPGQCDQPHPPSIQLADAYRQAASYPAGPFAAYNVTGDASDWLAAQGIPSATVELTNHTDLDWSQNLAGMQAVWQLYATALTAPPVPATPLTLPAPSPAPADQ